MVRRGVMMIGGGASKPQRWLGGPCDIPKLRVSLRQQTSHDDCGFWTLQLRVFSLGIVKHALVCTDYYPHESWVKSHFVGNSVAE